jgi:perosamine synthetase
MISSYRPYFDGSEILAALLPGRGRIDFEAAVASCVGARYALAFAYARSGMVALFRSLGLVRAEVIMPAYTCSVVAEAVVVSGNRPVFVDIDLADYNMDVKALKHALTSQTRAIIATHMHGYPADVDAIRQAVGDDRVAIIEDAASALRPAAPGAAEMSSDAAFYSFGPGKQLYTITGGVMVTNSPSLYQRMKAYRDQEMSRLPGSAWARRCLQVLTAYMALSPSLEEHLMRIKNVGLVRQTRDAVGLALVAMPRDYATAYADFQGRIGLVQLRKLSAVLERSRAFAEFYDQELRGVPGIVPAPVVLGATYTHYSMRVERRDEIDFRQRMYDQGVEVGLNFNYVVPRLKAYQSYANGQYSRAEQVARQVVNLPSYPALHIAEARRVVKCARRIIQECYA